MLKSKEILYGLDDLCIIPAACSDIRSRKECNPFHKENNKLPIFTAPMTAVVSEDNIDIWKQNDIIPIAPRNISFEKRLAYATTGTWAAFSLDEFTEHFVSTEAVKALNLNNDACVRVLIDIANGHMKELLKVIPQSKVTMRLEYGENVDYEIMAGNIANPETYRNLALVGCDYVRCSIGSGGLCTSSANLGLHYPLGSLLLKCYELKCQHDLSCKIIADGGINSYNRAITALACGADYVMIGSAFASCFESASNFIFGDESDNKYKYPAYISIGPDTQGNYGNPDAISGNKDFYSLMHGILLGNGTMQIENMASLTSRIVTPTESQKKEFIKLFTATENWCKVRKEIFGMSTRKAQALINKEGTKKTAEGITKYVPVLYTVAQWTDNFKSYLKSCMSYCNKRELDDFIGEVEIGIMSPVALNSFNK